MPKDTPSRPKQSAASKTEKLKKLPRLPKNARIHKRPILHPPVPSPYASAAEQKVVYISARTPFISAVKRVRKLLEEVEKRAASSENANSSRVSRSELGNDKALLKKVQEQLKSSRREEEEIVLKATGRGIERALGIGLYFQDQIDVNVHIRTGSVGVIDDIEVCADEEGDAEDGEEQVEAEEAVDKTGTPAEGASEEFQPESRIRQTSVIEIGITLKRV